MPGSHHVIYLIILRIMGCGHSKSNIQSKKDRNRNNVRKEEIPQKDSDDDDSVESDVEEVHEKTNELKTITTNKTNEIPLTVAQKKLSCSQQNFFKMLDEKIESGKDYDDSNSAEIAENTRLTSLLKDWETASAGSRSLEGTPKKNTFHTANGKLNTAATANSTKGMEKRMYTRQNTTPIPQSVIHQSYGVTPMSTRECSLTYIQTSNQQLPSSSTYQPHNFIDYSYQAFSPLCATQLVNNSSPPLVRSNDNQRLCSIRASKQNSIPYDNNNSRLFNHPRPPVRKPYTNGDLIQQQMQIEQVQYRQAKELAHFRLMKEQQLIQQQQLQLQHNQVLMRNYQSSIHIPIAVAQSYKETLSKNQIER